MIDFHSHIVFGVDDGAQTIEDTLEIIEEAKKVGFKAIIATPHYMEDYYEYDYNEIKKRIDIIRQKVKGIEIYHGNEIYSTINISDFLNKNITTSINNSKYVLIEFPMREEPINLMEVIYQLLSQNKIPIVAHPERYIYVQKDPNMLYELIEEGVLFQANFGSIIGQYGKEAQKTVKLLLNNDYIHFLGSDVHRQKSIYTRMENIIYVLEKEIGKRRLKELTIENPIKVLKNEEIEPEMPNFIKKGFWSNLFNG